LTSESKVAWIKIVSLMYHLVVGSGRVLETSEV